MSIRRLTSACSGVGEARRWGGMSGQRTRAPSPSIWPPAGRESRARFASPMAEAASRHTVTHRHGAPACATMRRSRSVKEPPDALAQAAYLELVSLSALAELDGQGPVLRLETAVRRGGGGLAGESSQAWALGPGSGALPASPWPAPERTWPLPHPPWRSTLRVTANEINVVSSCIKKCIRRAPDATLKEHCAPGQPAVMQQIAKSARPNRSRAILPQACQWTGCAEINPSSVETERPCCPAV